MSSFHIKSLSCLISERQMCCMIVSTSRQSDPVFVFVSLYVDLGPEYVVHGLYHIELALKPNCHGAMTNSSAGTIHNQWINAIKPENGYNISRFEVCFSILVFMYLPLLYVPLHEVSQKLYVLMLHVARDMSAEPW